MFLLIDFLISRKCLGKSFTGGIKDLSTKAFCVKLFCEVLCFFWKVVGGEKLESVFVRGGENKCL